MPKLGEKDNSSSYFFYCNTIKHIRLKTKFVMKQNRIDKSASPIQIAS